MPVQNQDLTRVNLEDLSDEIKALLDRARGALRFAAPDFAGRFKVGAALLTRRNRVITGANKEMGPLSSILCAERSAISRAYDRGLSEQCIALAVVSQSLTREQEDNPIPPCSECRVWIWRVATLSGMRKNFPIYIASYDLKIIRVMTIGELYPYPFDPAPRPQEREA